MRIESCQALFLDLQVTSFYSDPFVHYACSDLTDQQHIQSLLEQDFADPWGLDEDGRLHVRLNVLLWKELQYAFPECMVAIENVEDYVRKAEKEMFNNTRPGATWFEEYVRLNTYGPLLCFSYSLQYSKSHNWIP